MKKYQREYFSKLIVSLLKKEIITRQEIENLGYNVTTCQNHKIITRIGKGLFTMHDHEKELNSRFQNLRQESKKASQEKDSEKILEINSEMIKMYPYYSFGHYNIMYINAKNNNFKEVLDAVLNAQNNILDPFKKRYLPLIILLLSRVIPVSKDILDENIANINNNNYSKNNTLFSKYSHSIIEGNYENALEQVNDDLAIETSLKGFNNDLVVIRSILIYLVKNPDKEIKPLNEKPQVKKNDNKVSLPPKSHKPKIEVPPKVNTSSTLLIEYINQGEYDKALDFINQNSIENGKEVIRILIEKLSSMNSLITETEPLKVIESEEVEIIPLPSEEKRIYKNPLIDDLNLIEQESLLLSRFETYLLTGDTANARITLQEYDKIIHRTAFDRNIYYLFERLEQAENIINEKGLDTYLQIIASKQKLDELVEMHDFNAYKTAVSNYHDLVGDCLDYDLYYCHVLFVEGRNEDIVKCLTKYLITSHEPNMYHMLAKAYYRLDDLTSTKKMCYRYNGCLPEESIKMYLLLANCFSRQKNFEKEIEYLKIAKKIVERKEDFHYDIDSQIKEAERKQMNPFVYTKNNK